MPIDASPSSPAPASSGVAPAGCAWSLTYTAQEPAGVSLEAPAHPHDDEAVTFAVPAFSLVTGTTLTF